MKSFLKYTALFLTPVLAFCLFFCFVLFQSKEHTTEQEAVKKAMDVENILFGLAYRDNTGYFKKLLADEKQANLLILGTSRSMQFHSQFFTSESFFNAGGACGYINSFEYFLSQMESGAKPDTVIMVMDQYFFNGNWVGTSSMPEDLSYGQYDFSFKTAFWETVQGWGKGKYSAFEILTAPGNYYGFSAAANQRGFLSDGSYSYGKLMTNPRDGTDVGFHDSFDRIAKGINRFEYASEIYPKSIEVVESLLKYCSENEIKAVLIIPPYAPSVYAKMKENGNYAYLDLIYPTLSQLCAPYGFEVYDFTNMPQTSDDEYVDGYHGGDLVYAKIALELSEKSSILSGMINTQFINEALENTPSPLKLSADIYP